MDMVIRYRQLIRQHMLEVAAICSRSPQQDVETLCVLDDERDHYAILSIGWTKTERVNGITMFVRIRDGIIRIEEDWTEDGIGNALLEAGVPREDIVLALHEYRPSQSRPSAKAAVA